MLCATLDRWSGAAAAGPGSVPAYLFEASGAAPRKVLAHVVTLLAHPQQRLEQELFRPPFELRQAAEAGS